MGTVEISEKVETRDLIPRNEAVFKVRGVSKVYRMGEVEVHALRAVDLDLYAGEFAVLLGASGSGKSTLLNIIDEPLSRKVRLVEPQAFTKVSSLGVEEQRVNVIIDFDEPPDRLGDNFRVDVRIVLREGKDILRVPSSALFRQSEEWHVFVAVGSRARSRKVEIGQRTPFFAEVFSGLSEGDLVILHPPNSVADGTRIDRN